MAKKRKYVIQDNASTSGSRVKHRVRRHKHRGYSVGPVRIPAHGAFTIPAHRVKPGWVRAHMRNPGIPEMLESALKLGLACAAAAGGIVGVGKVVQMYPKTDPKLVAGGMALAGALGGGAIAMLSPGAGAAFATTVMVGAVETAMMPTPAAAPTAPVGAVARNRIGMVSPIMTPSMLNTGIGAVSYGRRPAVSRHAQVGALVDRFA